MKALSLTQPYANWIWDGSKSIETRTWKTSHRGPILICVTKQKVVIGGELIEPRGVAICIVDIVNCRPMFKDDEEKARFAWRKGLWAWCIENVKQIKPFPVKGQLRIFNVDYETPEESEADE